ncbi:MAG: c-type cytochrome [Candidatus Thiosymbion ectosymbiont of Robbea hypermnestra]|nr:c-type cytochrome [Candidatus Thiosymbion ectosymbiont of Robbea hypermnestra]
MVYILPGIRSSGNQGTDRSTRTALQGGVGSAPAIYRKACAACHDTGVAGAPGFGDQTAWDPRGRQGVQRLLRTVVAGKGAMPPRGTCADCSDADLEAVIEYLLVQAGYVRF